MNVSDMGKADFAALLKLAESKYHAWHRKELRPERDRRISELKKQNLTSGGRAVYAMRIYRETLERDVRERIGFYAAIAREQHSSEMVSKQRLEEFRERIMISVRSDCGALKGNIERDARAAGDLPESALPNEHRCVQLQADILDVVNTELRVLEAEGKFAGHLCPVDGNSTRRIVEGAMVGRRRRFLQEPLPAPPSKVGGRATASVPSRRIVTGPINYPYPPDFPESSRDRVKTEEIRAVRDFNEKCDGARSERELRALLTTCVMRPVLVFCREAIQLHWGADRIDSHIRDFVLRAQIWAGLPTNSEAQLEFEKSAEWREYEDALLALDVAPEHLGPEPAGDAVPKAEETAPARASTVTSGSGNGADPSAAETGPPFPERAAWLKDRLRERSWNKHDVSRQRGPDRKTVQKILDGKGVREDVLEKLATALSKAPDSKKLPKVTLLDIPYH